MTNLELQIEAWHNAKFGKDVKIPETYRKLCEEVGELGQALMKQDSENIGEEIGDIIFVLTHLLRKCCPDRPSINQILAQTLNKNERRILRFIEK